MQYLPAAAWRSTMVVACGTPSGCLVSQGVANNARGLGAELEVAESAPGVVAVSSRKGCDGGGAFCEMDIVAQQGHAWIEVKSHSAFGLHSQHWLGNSGHTKGGESVSLSWLV